MQVEGHQCHRVAYAHRKLMLKRSFVAVSPNGRFTDGAAAIDGVPLQRVEVHGKNLFYFFAQGAQPPVVLHGEFVTATCRLLPPNLNPKT